jgi:ABC-type dipeptide/oligopeptide/nickel transport system permease subunit
MPTVLAILFSIAATVSALDVLGDGLHDVLDPKHR